MARLFEKQHKPIEVIQFGEGGFLRGFADWMLQKMSDSGLFAGSVAVVQPIKEGLCDILTDQGCRYTHLIRGAEGVEQTVVDILDCCVKPYEDFEKYLSLAEIPTARYIISNTTEAGIVYSPNDQFNDTPPATFPAKLTRLLFRRYEKGLSGFVFLPCELIDRNGDALKHCILQYAALWKLEAGFVDWLRRENVFCNTLVDRINTGYPKGEAIDVGFDDKMINTSEYFHLWVIETDYDLERELPFSGAGLNVIVTKDGLEKYRTRKVRILNGAHTSMVCYALLSGLETVKECMDDEKMRAFVHACLFDEIIPTLDLPKEELKDYAAQVLTRFSNPYIKHYLRDISLNSVSKFKVRVLPSIKEYIKRLGDPPARLCFALAKLIEFYRNDAPRDSAEVIEKMRRGELSDVLADASLWGEDLSYLSSEVKKYANTSL